MDSVTPEILISISVVVLFALGWIAGGQR
ncbi:MULTISPECIES: tail virion protein G7P-2 [Janthinobacterium]|nr:tail virion protein G7P-2 [Janthinobacterium sp. PAMC25594]